MLDLSDKKLIELLMEDAQQSSETLGKRLKVSSATVRRRTKKLIQNGVLRIMAVTDPSKVGAPLAVVIAFDVVHEKLDSITKSLANRPEVRWVSTTTGRFDLIIIARFGSTEELANFTQKELPKLEGIRDSETFVCLHVEKALYLHT